MRILLGNGRIAALNVQLAVFLLTDGHPVPNHAVPLSNQKRHNTASANLWTQTGDAFLSKRDKGSEGWCMVIRNRAAKLREAALMNEEQANSEGRDIDDAPPFEPHWEPGWDPADDLLTGHGGTQGSGHGTQARERRNRSSRTMQRKMQALKQASLRKREASHARKAALLQHGPFQRHGAQQDRHQPRQQRQYQHRQQHQSYQSYQQQQPNLQQMAQQQQPRHALGSDIVQQEDWDRQDGLEVASDEHVFIAGRGTSSNGTVNHLDMRLHNLAQMQSSGVTVQRLEKANSYAFAHNLLDEELYDRAGRLRCPKKFNRTVMYLSKAEVRYAQCPPGYYLGQGDDFDRKLRAMRLRRAMCEAKSMGWVSGNDRERSDFKKRGFASFESSVWPKAEGCKRTPIETTPLEVDPRDRFLTAYRPDHPPPSLSKMVNSHFDAEFLLSWKVASTAFPDYLRCAYTGKWEMRAASNWTRRNATIAAAVRYPIGRWVSAASEILERSINHWCPTGPCSTEDGWGQSTLEKIKRTTSWYNVVDPDQGGYSRQKTVSLVEALVQDTACNYYSYASEHLSSQANFMAQNPGSARNLSVVLKLEDIDEGLSNMRSALGVEDDFQAMSECSFVQQNVKACKPNKEKVPSSEDMMEVLSANKELLQQLCLVYAQDFVCFDYDLPEECKGLF